MLSCELSSCSKQRDPGKLVSEGSERVCLRARSVCCGKHTLTVSVSLRISTSPPLAPRPGVFSAAFSSLIYP